MKKKILEGIMILVLINLGGCHMYEDFEFNNPYDPDSGDTVFSIPYSTIILEGDTSEWSAIESVYYDGIGEVLPSGFPQVAGGDITEVKVAQDNESIYFYISSNSGYPLQTPGSHINISLHSESYNLSLDLSHDHDSADSTVSLGTIGQSFVLNNYSISSETFYGSVIRFPGTNPLQNAIEFGLPKSVYWDQITEGTNLHLRASGWLQNYDDQDGVDSGGELDSTEENPGRSLILREPAELAPTREELTLFPRYPSPTIDGATGEWSEEQLWFKDMTDDDSYGQGNTNLEKIYMNQDDSFLYFLLTFSDPAPFDTPLSIDINFSREGAYNHSFTIHHNGGTWDPPQVNYIGSDVTGHSIASSDGIIEVAFDKYMAWGDLPYGGFLVHMEVFEEFGNNTDDAFFTGSYKAESDPTPVDQP